MIVGLILCTAQRASESACPNPTPTYPADDGWVDLVYTSATDGYDNHDPCYLAKAQCLPPASLCGGRPCAGSTIRLRGNVQCHSGKQTCFTDEAVSRGFASMPLACRPPKLWESTQAQLDGNGHGYSKDHQQLIPLRIAPDGTVTLQRPVDKACEGDEDCPWVIHLDGVTCTAMSNWGWKFISWLGAGCIAYIGGGVVVGAKTRGKPARLDAHPHHATWLDIYGMIQDGVRFARGSRGVVAVEYESTTRQQGQRSDAAVLSPSPTKVAKEKKAKGYKRKSSREPDAAELGRPLVAKQVQPSSNAAHPQPQTAATQSVPAGGGGRWVHVPN